MYTDNKSDQLLPKEVVIGSIWHFKCSWHTLAGLWWRSSSSVDSIDTLIVSHRAVASSEVEPRHSTVLPWYCTWGCVNCTSLLGHDNAILLVGCGVQVELGGCCIKEEMVTQQFKVGGRE